MPDQRLERIRWLSQELAQYGDTAAGTGAGLFVVRGKGAVLRIMSADDQGEGWEHVSVSLHDRCPTWDEMCFVKDLFWLPEEAVFQLHPPESEYVNNHPFCLHLWRSTAVPIPLPPSIFVGVKGVGILKSAEEAADLRRKVLP
jgi:hypothetical protein